MSHRSLPSPSLRTRLGAVTAIALAALLGTFITPSAAAANNASISGTVLGEGSPDFPLESVQATVYDSAGSYLGSAMTDEFGNYEVTNLPARTYNVRFASLGFDNFAPQWWSGATDLSGAGSVPLAPGEAATGIDAVLVEGGTLSGTVLGAGAPEVPLEGVQVNLFDVDGFQVGFASTNPDGSYAIQQLPAGEFTAYYNTEYAEDSAQTYLNAYWDGKHTPETADVISATQGQTLTGYDIVLDAGGRISGTVRAPGTPNVPLEGAAVSVYTGDGRWMDGTSTDASGHYTFPGLIAGDYKVTVWATGFLPSWWSGKKTLGTATVIPLAASQEVTGKDFVLDAGATISGNIKAAGSPNTNLAGAWVTVVNANSEITFADETDSSGNYFIGGLEPGSYTLNASPEYDSPLAPQWWSGKTSSANADYFSLTAHQAVTGRNMVLAVGAKITGRVTSASNPTVGVEGIDVTAHSDDPSIWFYAAGYTDEDGYYSIEGLTAGSYTLQARDGGAEYAPQWWHGKRTQESSDRVVVAASQTVSGKNFQIEDGATVSGTISIEGDPDFDFNFSEVFIVGLDNDFGYWGTSVNSSGQYEFPGLPAGEYSLYVEDGAAGSVFATEWWNDKYSAETADSITISVGESITSHDLLVGAGATITGKVTGAGTPDVDLAGIHVSALSEDGTSYQAWTDEHGDYVLTGLAPGGYTLAFNELNFQEGVPNGYVTEWWEDAPDVDTATVLSVSAGDVVSGTDVVLDFGGDIAGVVTNSAGELLDTVTVAVWKDTGAGLSPVGTVVTNGYGAYTIPGLGAGNYTVGFTDYTTGNSFDGTGGYYYHDEFWNDRPTLGSADPITVIPGSSTSGKNAVLAAFSHLPNLTSTPTPTITGTALPGQTLTVVAGTWAPAPVTLTYQWKRDGVDVSGKTASTYAVTTADLGHALSVSVTGTKSSYTTTTKTSAPTAMVTGVLSAPIPAISGTGAVGQTLTAVPGAWGPAPVTLSYQWYRNGEAVDGETASTYVLGGADAGLTVTVTVTGTKTDYTTQSKTSLGKFVGSVLSTSAPSITGIPTVGKPQTAVPGTWGPAPVTLAYQWKRDGIAIVGAISSVYTATAADSGKSLTVTVTGAKAGYTTTSETSSAVVIGNAFTAAPIPVIVGTPTVGTDLIASVGVWGPAPVTLAFQWLKDGSPIAGETGSTYTPTTADADSSLTFRVTATKAGFTPVSVTSAAKLIGLPLSDIGIPAISGQPTVGQVLSANPGSWSPAPVTFAFQWNRGGVAIPGATGSTYTAVTADGGKQLTVTVTGSKASYLSVASTSSPVVIGFALTGPIPTITGVPTVGQRVTAVPGTWAPAPVTLTYQWYRDGVAIAGATANSFLLSGVDAGTNLTVEVRGAKTGYTSIGRASANLLIGLALATPPIPIISGVPTVGETLTAVSGAWSPDPVDLTYQWKRAGVAIAGATASDYTLVAGDLAKAITVTITGSKAGYTGASATSAAKTVGSALTVTPTPSVTGTPSVGSILTAVPGVWAPAPVALSYKWLRNGVAIAGATLSTYKLVTTDAGQTVTVTVTGAKSGYTSVDKTSTGTAIESLITAPTPLIFGIPTVGETLSADPGAWGPDPVDLTFQWKRAGAVIPGATAVDYTLVAGDLAKAITVTVAGAKSGYTTTSKTSAASTIGSQLTPLPIPSITGTPAVGSTLTAVPGTWGPAPVSLSYKWLRNGVVLAGATLSTYKLVVADAGQIITVMVTGTKSGFTPVPRLSSGTDVQSLLTTVVPTIAGTPTVNETLTVVPGAWGPDPVDLTYQWKRAGVAIAAATAADYLLVTADIGKAITVTVSGAKADYTTASTTSAAKTINNVLTATPTPTITGTPAVGSTLTAVPGVWAPAPVTLAYKWLRNGVAISGAVASTYKLVTADAGQTVTVTVTGSKTGFASVPQTSAGTAIQSLLTTAVPTIAGVPTVGEILSAVPGAWGPDPVALTFQWKRAGVAIAAATEADYLLVTADIGKVITVTVTGAKADYTSASTTSVGKTINNVLTATPTPVITGTLAVGSTLTAVPGVWTPAPVTLAYKWLRNGVAISGAVASTYKLVTADAGQTITVTATGSKTGFASVPQTSAGSEIQSLLTAPVPTITGTPTVNETLTVVPGAWGPDPVDLTFQWKRAGVAIPGATDPSYLLVTADIGKAITVTVTGAKADFTSASTTSAAKTINNVLTVTPTPTITGTPAVGSTLTAVPGVWAPAPVTLAYKWLRNGVAIAGATLSTYKLVTADAGQTVTVTVTGSKTGFASVPQTSADTVIESLLTTAVPVIAGTPTVGETLSAIAGLWGPDPVALTYQWKRAGVAVPAATQADYLLGAADLGKAISVTVTGAKTGYTTASTTSVGTVIGSALTLTPVPTITGTPAVGSTLIAAPGTWGPAPVTLAYQWKRNGVAIVGATLPTYKLVTADAGQTVTVTIKGAKTSYTSVAQTSAGTVVESLLTVTPTPTITGIAAVGETVSVIAGVWGPGAVSLDYQWRRAGVVIAGATGSSYTLVPADAGVAITAVVIGFQSGYTTVGKTSLAILPFAAAPTPTITGAGTIGSVATAVAGVWGTSPVTLAYQWKRNGVGIAGATLATYTLAAADLGTSLTVTVTGTKSGYAAIARTSDAVTPWYGLIATPRPSIGGVPSEGGTVIANFGEWGPTPVTLAFQWFADGVPIDGATESSYIVAVPNGTILTVSVTGSKTNYLTVTKVSPGVLI